MKRTGLSVIAIAIALTTSLSLLAACDKAEGPLPKVSTAEQPAPQMEVKQDGANGAANSTTAPSQSERESTLQMARQEIDQLTAQVEALKVKAQDASVALKEKLASDIRGFEPDLKEVETKFNALKVAGANAWQDMKTAFTASIDKLKASVEKSSQKSSATGSSY
ncbi:MAG: hypothetical protein HHJ12_18995 [Glaciimonas sp.]|nr:hypothetical protein [Glaciimonas sp.]